MNTSMHTHFIVQLGLVVHKGYIRKNHQFIGLCINLLGCNAMSKSSCAIISVADNANCQMSDFHFLHETFPKVYN